MSEPIGSVSFGVDERRFACNQFGEEAAGGWAQRQPLMSMTEAAP